MQRFVMIAILLSVIGVSESQAGSIIAYRDPADQGTENFTGNMALLFDVLTPINVTALGVFNADGTGVIAGTVQVVIYNTLTHLQVTPVTTFHGTYFPSGYDVFLAIG